MSKYVVSVHLGTGSMAEGMVPQVTFGTFTDINEAKGFADLFYDHCALKSKTCNDEMLTCVSEIVGPHAFAVEPAEVGVDQVLEDDQLMIDMVLITEKYFGEYWDDAQ